MQKASLPRVFVLAGTKRGLRILAVSTLLCGAAMLPAIRTMADHGATVLAFESAGGVAGINEILAEWGSAGKSAMRWQIVLDTPFLISYGLFLAGACAAVARRARAAGMRRLEGIAALAVWLGPVAAGVDFLQNVSLGIVLAGHVAQPWPRISAVAGVSTMALGLGAALFAAAGGIATRRNATARARRS